MADFFNITKQPFIGQIAQNAQSMNEMSLFTNHVQTLPHGKVASSDVSSGENFTLSAPQNVVIKKEVPVDKNSVLYEKALELENYFVKILVSSMRNTLLGTDLYGNTKSFASKTYNDMMYDEFSTRLTQNADFGLAEQIYQSLS